jgi:S-formylglutathione hydrolase FrmB
MKHGWMTILSFALVATAAFGSRAATAQHSAVVGTPIAGHYERVAVHGASLDGNLDGDSADRMVSIYLPPSYAKSPKRRYPVLYFLHGFNSDDVLYYQSSQRFPGLPALAEQAFAHGTREMIIVTPDAHTKFKGSMYSSSVATGDWETFVTSELVSYVDTHYRTLARPESRGLAGHSMGGYGTLRLGMKHPHVFHSLYALSPCCLAANLPGLNPSTEAFAAVEKVQTAKDIDEANLFVGAMLAQAAAWSPNPHKPPLYFDLPVESGKLMPDAVAAWAANAPLSMAHQYLPSLKTYDGIVFDAGTRETYSSILQTVKALDKVFTDYGIKHTTEIYEGDHGDLIAERLEKKVLPFFSERLKF